VVRIFGHSLLALAAAVVTLAASFAVIVAGPAWWSGGDRETAAGRVFRVHRPEPRRPRPGLVLDLHPSGANGFLEQATTRLTGRADQEGWLVAYPDSAVDWSPYGTDGDEVPFLAAVIDRLVATDGVDPDRVYVTGLSRGAMEAYRVACELSPRIAAIAAVAGNMADARGDAGGTGCRPERAVSVLAIHGTADTAVPIAGGGRFAPFTDVVEQWRELDGCAPGASAHTSGSSTVTSWACRSGSEVRTIVVTGAGHTWPGTPLAGLPWGAAEALDASAAVADFFAGHRRASR
jgi:polyhydroxybutyrate depolymerase